MPSPEESSIPEESSTPLICAMHPDEVQELLASLGIEATQAQAETIQRMVAQCGSLETVLALVDRSGDSSAA